MNSMTDYSHPDYKDLYKEILIDHNFRYGKFSPIPYPNMNEIRKIQIDWNKKGGKDGND